MSRLDRCHASECKVWRRRRLSPCAPSDYPVANLDLDPLNPRLVVPGGVSQSELTRLLYEEEGLDELVPSFIENGYFEEEPLVVVPTTSATQLSREIVVLPPSSCS